MHTAAKCAALFATLAFAGFANRGAASEVALHSAVSPMDAGWMSPETKHGQILYVLVNNGLKNSYVALYHAYGKSTEPIGKITRGISRDPSALWTDAQGDVFVANALTFHSYIDEYAPGALAPMARFTQAVGLPFGGTVAANGAMYVSDAAIKGHLLGGEGVYPPSTQQPSEFLTQDLHVPHGVAVDGSGNVFVADIYGITQTYVVEFAGGSLTGAVLPLDNLQNGSGAFLEDLKLDSHGDIVVADAGLNAVRFYPAPYGHQSKMLTSGMSAPTGLAFGPDGSLFVGNEYVSATQGNVAIFAPGSNTPTRTLSSGILGGVLGVAIGTIH